MPETVTRLADPSLAKEALSLTEQQQLGATTRLADSNYDTKTTEILAGSNSDTMQLDTRHYYS